MKLIYHQEKGKITHRNREDDWLVELDGKEWTVRVIKTTPRVIYIRKILDLKIKTMLLNTTNRLDCYG